MNVSDPGVLPLTGGDVALTLLPIAFGLIAAGLLLLALFRK